MLRIALIILLSSLSCGVLSQKTISKIDTVLVKKIDDDKYFEKVDTNYITYDYKNYKSTIDCSNNCVFYGEYNNLTPMSGKEYCFDKDCILIEVWLYKDGSKESGIISLLR